MAMYITAMFGYDVSSSYIPIPVIATFIFLTTIISFTYAYDFICDETSITFTYRDLLVGAPPDIQYDDGGDISQEYLSK